MSHRRFSDRSGHRWEIRVRGRDDWEFRPVHGNPASLHHGESPTYQADPFELSEEELQAVLADATPEADPQEGRGPTRDPNSLFKDSSAAKKSAGLFDDYAGPTKPKSPFKDDH